MFQTPRNFRGASCLFQNFRVDFHLCSCHQHHTCRVYKNKIAGLAPAKQRFTTSRIFPGMMGDDMGYLRSPHCIPIIYPNTWDLENHPILLRSFINGAHKSQSPVVTGWATLLHTTYHTVHDICHYQILYLYIKCIIHTYL